MLTTDDIIQHFAVRLVYALESGATRSAVEVYREWRVFMATHPPTHGMTNELHSRLRDLIALRVVDHPNSQGPGDAARAARYLLSAMAHPA